ncbi:MAG: helix-turn-helix domain-containing protein [Clostridia bacterium]|nr:helix-turn-helix domain-containing protein [Clostridia bacterium]
MHYKKIYIDKFTKPISLGYSNNDTFSGDTVITIYDDYKISLVLTDNCGAVIGDNLIFPKRGDIVIFRPNEVHFGRFPDCCEYKFLSFLIPVDFFDNFFTTSKNIIAPFLDNSNNKINLIKLPEKEKRKLIMLAEELLDIIKDDIDSKSCDILIFAKLIEALDICNKHYLSQKSYTQAPAVPFVVNETMRKIEDDFPDFSGLDKLATHCGCSVTYLTQTFRKYTGKSIHNYLTERRLENARKQLQNGSSVTEACYSSGFSDCSAFIFRFKKHYGITPGKYKKCPPIIG